MQADSMDNYEDPLEAQFKSLTKQLEEQKGVQRSIEGMRKKDLVAQERIADALERIANCMEFAPDGPGAHAAAQHFNGYQQNTA